MTSKLRLPKFLRKFSPKAGVRRSCESSETRRRLFSTEATKRLFSEHYNVIYDSKCALCRMEIDWLKKKDTEGKLLFTDLESEEGYDERDPRNAGVSYRDAMTAMTIVHGATGERFSGIIVFPMIYETLSLGWLWSFTKMPLLGPLVADIYTFWAKYRTNVTRGKNLDTLVTEYENFKRLKQCNNDCKL